MPGSPRVPRDKVSAGMVGAGVPRQRWREGPGVRHHRGAWQRALGIPRGAGAGCDPSASAVRGRMGPEAPASSGSVAGAVTPSLGSLWQGRGVLPVTTLVPPSPFSRARCAGCAAGAHLAAGAAVPSRRRAEAEHWQLCPLPVTCGHDQCGDLRLCRGPTAQRPQLLPPPSSRCLGKPFFPFFMKSLPFPHGEGTRHPAGRRWIY